MFTVIVPSYSRPSSVLEETFQSLAELGNELTQNCQEILLMDQNWPCLQFSHLNSIFHVIKVVDGDQDSTLKIQSARNFATSNNKIPLLHFFSLRPSVTYAKNVAIGYVQTPHILFLDDDVSVQPGCFFTHRQYHHSHPLLGMLGGREIVVPIGHGRPPWKEFLVRIAESIFSVPGEEDYKSSGHYIGRILPNSLFFCDFSTEVRQLIKVDTVRGCFASVKTSAIKDIGGFDETFQGSALREETDLCLRLNEKGLQNYFMGDSFVFHRRQMGGCNNLSKSYHTLLSKIENEIYFQQRHFPQVSRFFLLLRLLPLGLEYARSTWGLSFLILFQHLLKKSL